MAIQTVSPPFALQKSKSGHPKRLKKSLQWLQHLMSAGWNLAQIIYQSLIGFLLPMVFFGWWMPGFGKKMIYEATDEIASEQTTFYLYHLLYFITLPTTIMGGIGLLLFFNQKKGTCSDNFFEVKPGCLVIWRIVTRGTNQKALMETISSCRKEMKKARHRFPYLIEVVIEEDSVPHFLVNSDDLAVIAVPACYQTSKKTLFKARALHYALEASKVPDTAWLVHLDEETHPTQSGIEGIAKMITEEENRKDGHPRIGQGAILYHRLLNSHPLLTLADMQRTGDDLSRFYLQFFLGLPLFGIHGSFIVVRNDVEKSVGFDFGPIGSITEDAYWALACMEKGYRMRWVDGCMEEQCNHSVLDLLKQRRRWIAGLTLVGFFSPLKLQNRLPLLIFSTLWVLSQFTFICACIDMYHQVQLPSTVVFLRQVCFGYSATIYFLGLNFNLYHRKVDFLRRLGWYLAQCLSFPVVLTVEVAAMVYSVIKPDMFGFHVVKK